MTTTKELSKYRSRLNDVLEDAYLYIIPDRLPRLLRPIRCLTPNKCAITGKTILPGDYAYPCYENPVRLSPTGPARALIEEAKRLGYAVIPEGVIVSRVPPFHEIMDVSKIKKDQRKLQKSLEDEGTRLIKAATMYKDN